MKVSGIQVEILFFLFDHYSVNYFMSPTSIGTHVGGKDYNSASSWASRQCKPMAEAGLLIRSERGKYQLSDEGRRLVLESKEGKAR